MEQPRQTENQGQQQRSETGQPRCSRATPPEKRISGRSALMLVLVVLLIVAVLVVIAGIIPRVRARTTLKNDTDATAAPDVTAAKPTMGVPDQEVVVPGNMYAYLDAPIYARTSGYLKSGTTTSARM